MKRLIVSLVFILTATLVYAHISNDVPLHEEDVTIGNEIENKAALASLNDFSPPMYGIIGAATMALVIATRRSRI